MRQIGERAMTATERTKRSRERQVRERDDLRRALWNVVGAKSLTDAKEIARQVLTGERRA